MKNLKQITAIITLVIFTFTNFNGIAQTSDNSTPKGYSLEIPKELKMTAAEKANNTLLTASKYDEVLGGYVYVIGYVNAKGQAKLDAVLVPTKPSTTRGMGCTGGSYQACAMGCTNRPSEIGVLLCTGYCMINCAIK